MDKKIKYLYCKKFKIYSVVFFKIIFFSKKTLKAQGIRTETSVRKICANIFTKGCLNLEKAIYLQSLLKTPIPGLKSDTRIRSVRLGVRTCPFHG